jgi:hypothetical protein
VSIGDGPMPCLGGYDMDYKLDGNIWVLREVDRSWVEHGSD